MTIDILGVVILVVVLLFSMSIHELMHALSADWLGDDTARHMGRITLNPLAHIDPFFTVALPVITYILPPHIPFGAAKPVQVNFNRLRYDEFGGAIVGMIGPLTNLAIAAITALLFDLADPGIGTTAYQFFQIAIVLNVSLFVFNSIPWPPLDGSRLLYAFAPRALQEIMESIERYGLMGLVLFIFLINYAGLPIGTLVLKLTNLLAPGLVI
jgi:Zn-dependent protease